MERKEVLQQSHDLKSKIQVLMQAISEVSNYITVKLSDINGLNAAFTEVSSSLEKTKNELSEIEKSRDIEKKARETERSEFDLWKAEKTKEIEKKEQQARLEKEEASSLLASIKNEKEKFDSEKEEFNEKRRELEKKHAKIAELVG